MTQPDLLPADIFITTQKLIEDTLRLARALSAYPIQAVLACARSGLLPGSILAIQWHVPLFAVSPRRPGVVHVGGGYRMDGPMELPRGLLLLIDDTVNFGRTFYEVLVNNPELKHLPLLRAAIYVTPEAERSVDFAACIYPRPHYLEWCFANTFWAEYLGFDMDGILCEDPSVPDHHPMFHQHLVAARPIYLPRKYPITIVSARCEIFRRPTEIWLQRHQIRTKRLILWPMPEEERWTEPDRIARWKAEQLRPLVQSGELHIYIESDPVQAQFIADMVPMAVICPRIGRVYQQHLHCWWNVVVS